MPAFVTDIKDYKTKKQPAGHNSSPYTKQYKLKIKTYVVTNTFSIFKQVIINI